MKGSSDQDRSRFVLYVLLLTYISNQWCRYLLNYLYAVPGSAAPHGQNEAFVSLRDSTSINDEQYGLLVGYSFSICYVLSGLVMGRAADTHNRRNIIIAGMLLWNGATILMGLSHSFWQLLASRIALGIGESFSAPASYSLIADYFPAEGRGEANGIYAFGVYIGSGLGSLSIAMAEQIGWRNTCHAVAIYGLMLAAVTLCTIREPRRVSGGQRKSGNSSKSEHNGCCESVATLLRSKLLVLLFAAGSVRFMAGYALGAYLPEFYAVCFPEHIVVYSFFNATVVSFGGALSSFLGGRVADRWEKAGNQRARLHVPAIGALFGIPCAAFMLLTDNFYISLAALFCEYLVAECWFGPAVSILQNALPPKVRGVGIAIFTLITTAAGSLMSLLFGAFEDYLKMTGAAPTIIRYELLLAVGSTYMLCALLFYWASFNIQSASGEEAQVLFLEKAQAFDASQERLPLVSGPGSGGGSDHHRSAASAQSQGSHREPRFR